MRTPKKNTSPARIQLASYCITDEQGTLLHRLQMEPGDRLRLHHFPALSHLLSSTERLDRLLTILTQWNGE